MLKFFLKEQKAKRTPERSINTKPPIVMPPSERFTFEVLPLTSTDSRGVRHLRKILKWYH
jgi:hypothetical protein